MSFRDFKITLVGSERKIDDSGIVDRIIPEYNLIVVDQGEGYFESAASGRVQVRANSAILILPGVLHSYRATPTWSERWLTFVGPGPDALRSGGWLDPAHPVSHLSRCHNGLGAFERCWGALRHAGPFAEERICASLREFFILSRSFCREKEDEQTPAHRARNILESEAIEGVRPEEIADRLEVPYSTLRRQFRRLTGRSLQEYGIVVRLNRARHLLLSTDKPVSQISDECGFEEPYYFTRLFKRRVGMAPTKFRETNYF